MNDLSCNEIIVFHDSMDSMVLNQYIGLSTHCSGHTLDLVFSDGESKFTALNSTPHIYISDHKRVVTCLLVLKNKLQRKKIMTRKTGDIDMQSLNNELNAANIDETDNVNRLADQLETKLKRVVDALALSKSITITQWKLNPWYDSYIRDQRVIIRRCEQ